MTLYIYTLGSAATDYGEAKILTSSYSAIHYCIQQ